MNLIYVGKDDLRESLKKIKNLISVTNRNIIEASTLCEEANKALDEEHAKQSAQFKRLMQDYQGYVAKAVAKGIDPEVNSMSFANFTEESMEELSEESDVKKECKDLFNKIAKETHPDKVDDPDLHALFKRAKDAVDSLDYLELMNISKEISGEGDVETQDLLVELKLLKESWDFKMKKLDLIRNSASFRIAQLYNSKDIKDNLLANKEFLSKLYDHMSMTMDKIDRLKSKLGEN